jgi:hypothetical protein
MLGKNVSRMNSLRNTSLARILAIIPFEIRILRELSQKILAERKCRNSNSESIYCKDSLRGIGVVADEVANVKDRRRKIPVLADDQTSAP